MVWSERAGSKTLPLIWNTSGAVMTSPDQSIVGVLSIGFRLMSGIWVGIGGSGNVVGSRTRRPVEATVMSSTPGRGPPGCP
jgi:hypothetical protein